MRQRIRPYCLIGQYTIEWSTFEDTKFWGFYLENIYPWNCKIISSTAYYLHAHPWNYFTKYVKENFWQSSKFNISKLSCPMAYLKNHVTRYNS